MEEKIKQGNPTLHRYLFTVTTFSKLLAMFFFILFPFIGFYLGIKYVEMNKINIPNTTPVVSNSNIRIASPIVFSNNNSNKIIQNISESLNKENYSFSEVKQNGLWWISDDGWNVYDTKAFGTSYHIQISSNEDCSGPGPDYLTAEQRKSCSKLPEVLTLNNRLMDIFIKNGFKSNTKNSSKFLDDFSLYDYQLGFQKDNVRCAVTTSSEIFYGKYPNNKYVYYDVICSDNFTKAYEDQLPYLKALVAYSPNLSDAVVLPKTRTGDFITVNINYRRTGTEGIMKNNKDGYKLLILTQQQLSLDQCKILKENNAPDNYMGCNTIK